MTTAPPIWTVDPDTGMQRADLASFGEWLAARREEVGKPVAPRNRGNRRTASKRALLDAIEKSGGRW